MLRYIYHRLVNSLFSPPKKVNNIWVNFSSPDRGCTNEVVTQIDNAQKSVCILSYNFTSTEIRDALINAYKRGVNVQFIIDHKASEDKSLMQDLASAGIPCYTDAEHAIAHNKVMILDSSIVLTGSFNWTEAAEHVNAENLLTINDPALAQLYKDNWNFHLSHSNKVSPP